MAGADAVGNLHQQAPVANLHVERVERLHLAELRQVPIIVGNRRSAQIDERVFQIGATESALAIFGHTDLQ